MENPSETRPRIRPGRTEMDFRHNGRTLTAVHPFYGPANSLTLLEQIRNSSEGLIREPTAPEVASFVHEYFDRNEPQAKEVQEIMRNFYRGFTGVLFLPKEKIAHFIDYPKFDKFSIVDGTNLLTRLNESRAQVSFEHLKEGPVGWQDIGKHPYFVAWAGEEGAGKLAELASKHSRKEAYIWVPNVSGLKKPTARVASLGSGLDGGRLYVYSYYLGDDDNSYAFGGIRPR